MGHVRRPKPTVVSAAIDEPGWAPAVLVEDSARLSLYPDISAILAGGAPLQLGTVIPDDFVQSYALNTTIGTAWQLGRAAALDVDFIHSYADHQTGFTDRNIPSSGTISATNPRPVREFAQVWMLENFTKSWYDALETQLRVHMPRSGRLASLVHPVAQLSRWRRFLQYRSRHAAHAAGARLRSWRSAAQPDRRRELFPSLATRGQRDPQADQRLPDASPGWNGSRRGQIPEWGSASWPSGHRGPEQT
jgi:hypothetical protein